MGFKIKTTLEHINELIEFYKDVRTEDNDLKKMIVRNLNDLRKREEKQEAK